MKTMFVGVLLLLTGLVPAQVLGSTLELRFGGADVNQTPLDHSLIATSFGREIAALALAQLLVPEEFSDAEAENTGPSSVFVTFNPTIDGGSQPLTITAIDGSTDFLAIRAGAQPTTNLLSFGTEAELLASGINTRFLSIAYTVSLPGDTFSEGDTLLTALLNSPREPISIFSDALFLELEINGAPAIRRYSLRLEAVEVVQAVPIPAAGWLLLAAVVGLFKPHRLSRFKKDSGQFSEKYRTPN